MYWCLCPGLCYVHMLWLTCLLLLCRYCNSLQYLCLTEAGTRYFSIKTVQTVQTELVSSYLRHVLQQFMCHSCIVSWHTGQSIKVVVNRRFSTISVTIIAASSITPQRPRCDAKMVGLLGATEIVAATPFRLGQTGFPNSPALLTVHMAWYKMQKYWS